jgi:hypothetical protein
MPGDPRYQVTVSVAYPEFTVAKFTQERVRKGRDALAMLGSGQWEATYESNTYADHTDSSASRSAADLVVQCGMDYYPSGELGLSSSF